MALRGYNVDEVDAFLNDVVAKLRRGNVTFAEDVKYHEFRMSLKGYRIEDVDELLERVAAGIDADDTETKRDSSLAMRGDIPR